MVIAKKGNMWYLRYRTGELRINKHGKAVRKEAWEPITAVDERYDSKRNVEPLARDLFNRISGKLERAGTTNSQPMSDFIEHKYFLAAEKTVRPSTLDGYKKLYNSYLKSRTADIRLFDFDTATAQQLLRTIASETVKRDGSGLAKRTLQHIKHFMSGVMTFAIQEGDVRLPANPIQLVAVPKGEETEETYAYNLDEIARMMEILPEPANTVVGTIAFTGLRKSELRGIRWQDIDPKTNQLSVQRTVWRTIVEEKTKTKGSRAPVPLVPVVQKLLEAHRNGVPADGFIFTGENRNKPLNVDNLATRVIRPALKKAGIKWAGWHGFRRGLATNLCDIGAGKDVAQAILRHANIKVTEDFYIKREHERKMGVSQAEMKKLVKAFEKVRQNARKVARNNSHTESRKHHGTRIK